MTELYKNKYRIPPARAQWWDYKDTAAYFITICTADRQPYFGEIVADKMQLSEIGEIVKTEWQKTSDLRPDMNITLDKFVVMPNHFHAIIIIGKNEFNDDEILSHKAGDASIASLHRNQFAAQSKNLSSIIRGYKSTVSKHCKNLSLNFAWQTRFHDHIIRNFEEYNRITEYITNNPTNWKTDKFHIKYA